MANAYRMTITIPPDVKAQMDQVHEQVNWSAVASEAFQRKVVEIRNRRTKTMSRKELIEKLRASSAADPIGYEAGHARGRRWVEETLPPARLLRNLARRSDKIFDRSEDGPGVFQGYCRVLAREATQGGAPSELNAFLDGIDGETKSALDHEDFVRGFVAGALEVWEEVKDEL
jgi:hypothetical protein